MRRICIAWGGMPAYAACAVRQFMTDYIGEVALIATASDVPKTCADEICGVKINWVLDEDGRSIEDVIGFVPDVLFVSGWFIPSFNRFVNEVNAYGGRVIVGTDNRDRSGWSGVIWSLYFRFKIKRKFSAFMTPGESGRRLLRKCGRTFIRQILPFSIQERICHAGRKLLFMLAVMILGRTFFRSQKRFRRLLLKTQNGDWSVMDKVLWNLR